ncbi:Phospholipase-like [Trema orientale]|uniref:Phospholipase-like n=1 Tax=Trema orientale TaxID=63057 RepID=A0A2P5EWP9_TREOI|nr:Phospholipase-like [Trema orientale]
MALNGKVRSDCNYASNPYHECTETCLRRIAEGKGRKEKKKSDNGSVVKDGDVNKKYEEKRVHPACSKASNPYHECNENCFKRISGAGGGTEINQPGSILDFPIKLGKKKMQESRSMPPRELENAPARDKVYNSSVSLPPKNFLSTEQLESLNGEHYSSSETYSGEIQVEDPLLNGKRGHSSHPEAASGILTTPDHPNGPPKEAANSIASEPPIHLKEDQNHHALPEAVSYPVTNEKREGTTGSASESLSFSFSGLPQAFEESDDDEAQSVISDASVSVGKYRVKGRLSPILQSIFDKYGDIAASCQLESIAMRSYYLECVCLVIQELQSTQIMQLTKSKVKEMFAILKDVESAGIDVSWLHRVLSESAETIEMISQHRAFEVAKTNCDNDLESTRKQLESRMEELALKEKEVAETKKLISETRAHLRELELKSSLLNDTVSSIKSKVESLNSKSLLDGVL